MYGYYVNTYVRYLIGTGWSDKYRGVQVGLPYAVALLPFAMSCYGENYGNTDSYDILKNSLGRLRPNLNVEISLSMLRYMGNWPPHGSLRWVYYLYTIVSFTFIVIIYVLVQGAFVIVVWGDAQSMISAAFLLMTNIGHWYKMTAIFFRKNRIERLLDTMASEIFTRDDEKYERIHTWYAWDGIFHHGAYQAIGGVAVFCWGFVPIADIISGNERRLPMASWYPYDTEATPAFEITCAQQILGAILQCVNNVALDTLATNLMTVACCQLEILKRNIQDIGNSAESAETAGHAYVELNRCIRHNNVIINFVNEIEDIFGTMIIYHCFVNCLIICLAAVHITQMKDYVAAEIIGTTMFLGAVTYQMFNFCWHGNELVLQSESVGLAAYSGYWWTLDERYKKSLLIVIVRSQRGLLIKAGGVLPVTLKTFMSIIQTSYSFFTVLQGSTSDPIQSG